MYRNHSLFFQMKPDANPPKVIPDINMVSKDVECSDELHELHEEVGVCTCILHAVLFFSPFFNSFFLKNLLIVQFFLIIDLLRVHAVLFAPCNHRHASAWE